ncbi:MAG TPA: hypothetical protein ENN81_05680 [Phycisphaerales bacterium]|nr:hypothetical protein [Phycisphaerales bacterium]
MRTRPLILIIAGILLGHPTVPAPAVETVPDLRLTSDDTRVSQSCRIVIDRGVVIEDRNNNGVLHVAASNITIEFAGGSVLRGGPDGVTPDQYTGYGIRIDGQHNVTIRGARISGFYAGLWATDGDGLTLEDIDASDNRRARLRSTPLAEDGADWLFPHNNDDNEWLVNYGAALYVEDSNNVTVRRCTVRHGQNALCLDRVNDSQVYDNDFSFNSGWGIALWRSSRNTITRNACDFCVRGYSHGVYNRGQDSAGILMFEQNNDNLIAENSATHGGDGFFGFAGREALGETSQHPLDWYKGRGNSGNRLIANDFSYAPAHGIEMTFSHGNVFYGNRLVGNAICGVWGGYSQDTLIARNHIEGNGEMAYGLERGGINIEHGRGNRILANAFVNNKCGIHLWWDEEGDLAKRPWALANGTDSKDNLITGNTFNGDALAYQFRGPSEVTIGPNILDNVRQTMQVEETVTRHETTDPAAPIEQPRYGALGTTRPVGAREHLRGRHNIIMTEWGPWDHESPLIRLLQDKGDAVEYSLHKMPPNPRITLQGQGVTGRLSQPATADAARVYTVSTTEPGLHPYLLQIETDDFRDRIRGTLSRIDWDVTFFKWTPDTDPRENLDAWRGLAQDPSAVSVRTGRLVFSYGYGGPSDQDLPKALKDADLGGDRFGMIARAHVPLPAGRWVFTTLSDDGVRVVADGRTLIDNWTWHVPARDSGILELNRAGTVEILVEHFEIDGYAVMELAISPAIP